MPALALFALLPGCFDAHGRDTPHPDGGDPSDAAPRDAGTDALHHTPADVGPPVDASGVVCSDVPIDFACTSHGNASVPVGVTFELPVYLGTSESCFCGESLDCAVEVHDRTIEIYSRECFGPLLCDACFPFLRGTCIVPPLSEGAYHVVVNGTGSFDLQATNDSPAIGPLEVCESVPGDHGCGTRYTPMARALTRYCHTQETRSGEPSILRATLEVGCGDLPTCQVRQTAMDLELVVRTVPTACDVECGPGPFVAEVDCAVPPLEPGRYRVHASSFTGGTELVVTDAPVLLMEVCGD